MQYYGNQYMPNYAPYYQMQRTQEPMQQYNRPSLLQGKTVDNLEVVKAIDIPLDGSISYFPLADGTAIISKQLQQDGTSKILVFKLSDDKLEQPKFVTENDLNNIKNEIKTLKEQIDHIEKRGD